MRARKKPIVVDVWKIEDPYFKDREILPVWVAKAFKVDIHFFKISSMQAGYLLVRTLEGNMRGEIGDYLIKGVAGELYTCKKEIFEKTYEVV